MAEYLCWLGWLEVYRRMVSVKVGFVKVDICILCSVLCIEMSRTPFVFNHAILVIKVQCIYKFYQTHTLFQWYPFNNLKLYIKENSSILWHCTVYTPSHSA